MHQQLKILEQNLPLCLIRDEFSFRKKLNGIRRSSETVPDQRLLAELSKAMERSRLAADTRRQRIPEIHFPDLPVSDKKDDIAATIAENQVIIVCGETGSGKTTQLPKICLAIGRGVRGFIGHTQPRRIAARTVAARIGEELGQTSGQIVGYKVRFHDQTRPDSLIKLMTDGILLAETQSDRYLNQYDTLILDEAHERSLNIDFLLGYLKWLLPRRPDLKLIVTSATIDPDRFSRHFDNAPVVEISGRTYPVETRYRPLDGEAEEDRDSQQAIVKAVDELYRDQPGDILVFLSGEREIRETAEALRKHHPADCEVLPLYSRLSVSEQARVFKTGAKIRIVLATNVAETSLTVPGIRSVIDTGYARISRYSQRSRIQRLPIEKISQASANQRAGRCGRIAPGVCVRLYAADDFEARPEFTEPEILRTNLAAVILQMTTLRLGQVTEFPFVEPPDGRMVRDGQKLLFELKAFDEHQNLTKLGRKLARLPIDPRLGCMILAAEKENCLSEVSVIAAALSIQDPRERPVERSAAADQKHAQFNDDQSDFLSFLNLWRAFEGKKVHLSRSKLRKDCRQMFVSYRRMLEWEDIHRQIVQLVKGELGMRPNQEPAGYAEIHRALLTGLLSNIGFKHDHNEYFGAKNLKFHIHPGSVLFKKRPKWIMAAEQVETSRVYARVVAKIEPEWVEKCAPHLIKRQHYDPHWERKPARAAINERVILYGLTIHNKRTVPLEKIDPEAARELFIRSALVNQDYDSRAPFFVHNQSLLESLEYLQHKGRRVDLLIGEDCIYEFFDERIPANVVSGDSFERWRRRAEKDQPRLLKLSREDLERNDSAMIDTENFPDHLVVAKTRVELRYHFEPGAEHDGVTAILPIPMLNQVDTEAFEWLVPGLLREKVTALFKALPKTIRRQLVPVADYVDPVLEQILPAQDSLHMALGRALKKVAGVSVPASAWRPEVIQRHLLMNFELVNEAGETIAHSRELDKLKQEHGPAAGAKFQSLANVEALRGGCDGWEFGDLPDTVDLPGDGHRLMGFPAVVDEGETVGLRLLGTEAEAREQHRIGLVRLVKLSLRKEVRYLKKNLSRANSSELVYNRLAPHPFLYADENGENDFRDDSLSAAIDKVFLGDSYRIRSGEEFDHCLETGKSFLTAATYELDELCSGMLQHYQIVKNQLAELAKNDLLRRDIGGQLELLIYSGFLKKTPYERIQQFPRYLKAVGQRLEKARQDRQSDQNKMNQVLPFWDRYWTTVKDNNGTKLNPPEFDEFRWSLEEFRVSIFAQSLKTLYPVSAKRLERAWAERKPD